MDFAQIEAFLVLSDELHFGRTAERLHVSQPRVSRLIAALETTIGGALFDRTSRRVTPTPLGVRLRDELAPAYEQLTTALAVTRAAARSPAGLLRLGFAATTAVPAVDQLVTAFMHIGECWGFPAISAVRGRRQTRTTPHDVCGVSNPGSQASCDRDLWREAALRHMLTTFLLVLVGQARLRGTTTNAVPC